MQLQIIILISLFNPLTKFPLLFSATQATSFTVNKNNDENYYFYLYILLWILSVSNEHLCLGKFTLSKVRKNYYWSAYIFLTSNTMWTKVIPQYAKFTRQACMENMKILWSTYGNTRLISSRTIYFSNSQLVSIKF